MSTPKKTPLYEVHKELKGNIVDFHGVLLPVLYSSIQEEHHAVRTNIGIFDVSHMGNIEFTFKDRQHGLDYFNRLLANDYSRIVPGKVIYSTLLYDNGTVVDDLMVGCISDTRYHVVVNSSNIEKDYEWIKQNSNSSVKIENLSDSFGIIAVQGPNAFKLIEKIFSISTNDMKFLTLKTSKYQNTDIIITRSGYTGEDGFEICVDSSKAVALFKELLETGKEFNAIPCGLGSRDTLRMESGLPLYGQELDDAHSPLQSMIAWSVKLNKPDDFIGKKQLLKDKDNYEESMIGFEIPGRAIARTGMKLVTADDREVGVVTSGTFAPTVKKNIGIGFIKKDFAGYKDLFIMVRNKKEPIVITAIPFYKRSK